MLLKAFGNKKKIAQNDRGHFIAIYPLKLITK